MAQTPLHVSAGYNRADIIKFLLDWQGAEKVELEPRNMVSEEYMLMCQFPGQILYQLLRSFYTFMQASLD
jgi:hypothetical protein